MKITEKQLLIMFRVLEGSLLICDRNDADPFGYSLEIRAEVYGQIVNQQSDKLVDVENTSE